MQLDENIYNYIDTLKDDDLNYFLFWYSILQYNKRSLQIRKMVEKLCTQFVKHRYGHIDDVDPNLSIELMDTIKNINIKSFEIIKNYIQNEKMLDYLLYNLYAVGIFLNFTTWLILDHKQKDIIFNYFKKETKKYLETKIKNNVKNEKIVIDKKKNKKRVFQLINEDTFECIRCNTYNDVKNFCKEYNIPNYRKFIKEYSNSDNSYYGWWISSLEPITSNIHHPQ